MEPSQRGGMTLQSDAHPNAFKHPPSYDEINVPYSFRLPAYRASYMRRFHPYPRYAMTLEAYPTDHDDELLDLSILEERIPQPAVGAVAPAGEAPIENNRREPQDAAEGGGGEGVVGVAEPERPLNDTVEQEGGRSGFFLRMDAATALEVLQLELKDGNVPQQKY